LSADNPAQIFETKLVPAIFAPWARVLIDFATPKSGEHVLDAACGTGVVSRLVAPMVGPSGRTVAIDFDPIMIATAKGLCPDVECSEADLQNLPFADGIFDLVICQQGLQFLPDRVAGLAQIYRVLNPGGRMALAIWTDLRRSPGHAILFDALGTMLGLDMSRPPAWSLTDSNHVMQLVSAAGFVKTEMTVTDMRAKFSSAQEFVEILIDGSSKLTRQALAQLPADRKAAFIHGVTERLQQYETDTALEVPMESMLLVAHKQ
jgi:ubiquinone/menaquinone biosynthesis C-methylase UbiE